ncbi:unnamed protein product [Parajaminaea phylloscopi]
MVFKALPSALVVALAALTLSLKGVSSHRPQAAFFSATSPRSPSRKIAIVGGGPSGTSAAYWLSKAQAQLDQAGQGDQGFDVHLYEKEERIGGRTKAVYPYGDAERYEPAELGASIFADVNRNMVRFAKDLRLPTHGALGEEGAITAIWDGQQFVIEDLGDSWWSSAKLFWRYGYSPLTTRSLVKDLVTSFLELYDPKFLHQQRRANVTASGFPWSSVEDIAKAVNFDEAAATDAHTWFYGKGVSQLFTEEIIEAATRVNYGQNTDGIHALGAGVSLAASGAAGIRGGNSRLFQELLARSGARVHLGAHGEVTGIVKLDNIADAVELGLLSGHEAAKYASPDGSSAKWWVGTAAGTGGLYDAVFLSTPWHNAGIALVGTEALIPVKKYVHLHVTLAATNASHPKPKYFGRTEGSDVPITILTTSEALRHKNADKTASPTPRGASERPWTSRLWGRSQRPRPEREVRLDFNSLNYIAKLPKRPDGGSPEHLVKIFSSERLSDDLLDEILGMDRIGWLHREEWDAYPVLSPTRNFAAIEPDNGLFYVNAFEPLVSTMETSTLASRNAVALLLEKWFGPEFVNGKKCHFAESTKRQAATAADDARDGWDGWGCDAG